MHSRARRKSHTRTGNCVSKENFLMRYEQPTIFPITPLGPSSHSVFASFYRSFPGLRYFLICQYRRFSLIRLCFFNIRLACRCEISSKILDFLQKPGNRARQRPVRARMSTCRSMPYLPLNMVQIQHIECMQCLSEAKNPCVLGFWM